MADTTTTTTTEDKTEDTSTTTTSTTQASDKANENTTTTTTRSDSGANSAVTDTTTITAGAVSQPVVEKRGELAVDESAEARKLQEQPAEERIADAQAQGLQNHAREHAGDDADYATTVSRDKVS